MKRENIEMKSDQYAQEATPTYVNGDFDRNAIAQSFEDGANWRINSVWHNNDVMPECYRACVIIDELGTPNYGGLCYDNFYKEYRFKTESYNYTMDKIKKWAYVRDLFPSSEVKDGKELRTYSADDSMSKFHQKI